MPFAGPFWPLVELTLGFFFWHSIIMTGNVRLNANSASVAGGAIMTASGGSYAVSLSGDVHFDSNRLVLWFTVHSID